ncbi:MAG: hypothetical protein AAFY48_14720, partial [Bacteroidota bacterium]
MKATDQKTTTSQSVQKKEQGPFFQKESGDTSFFNGAGLSSLAAGGGSSFFSGTGIQTKLTINEPGDQYEQEAD